MHASSCVCKNSGSYIGKLHLTAGMKGSPVACCNEKEQSLHMYRHVQCSTTQLAVTMRQIQQGGYEERA